MLLGVEREDDEAKAKRLVERVTSYLVFEDSEGKMNLSVKDVGGSVLVVSHLRCQLTPKKGLVLDFRAALPHKRLSGYMIISLTCLPRFCQPSAAVLRRI